MKEPNDKQPHNTEDFDDFAAMMHEFVDSFNKVMQGDDPNLKLSAIELLGEVKSTMGDTLQHLMEKYNVYPSDIERCLKEDSEMAKKVHEVNDYIEKVNRQVIPEIEKALGQPNLQSKKKRKSIEKRLKSKD